MSPVLDVQQVKQQALQIGFHKVGIARVAPASAAAIARNQALQAWLNQGFHADMAWMANPKRQDITQVMPEARSLICVALNYYAQPERVSRCVPLREALRLGPRLSSGHAKAVESAVGMAAIAPPRYPNPVLRRYGSRTGQVLGATSRHGLDCQKR